MSESDLLGLVQREVAGMEHLKCLNQGGVLDVFIFEGRCLRGDVIWLYRMFGGVDRLKVASFLSWKSKLEQWITILKLEASPAS